MTLVARNVANLTAVEAECKKVNPNIEIKIMPKDVGKLENFEELFHTRHSIVVNNAGVMHRGRVLEQDPEELQRMLTVNIAP